MAKIKTEISYSKGFKRIYFVIAGIWIALMSLAAFGDFSFCVIHGDKISITGSTNANSFECVNYNTMSLIVEWLLMCGLVVPIYYFIAWIISGFKK